MKFLMIFTISLMPIAAMAQQQSQQQHPLEYNLKVTPVDVDLISKGLGTQPFNDVVPLIGKLRAQVIEQQQKFQQSLNPVESSKGEVEKK